LCRRLESLRHNPTLKDQFQCELNLPRRSGFACREARAGDSTKGRAAHDVAWLAEVRMVEEVEELHPELYLYLLTESGVLDDRKIRVIEPWSWHDVAAQSTETGHGREGRRVEPAIRVTNDIDRPGEIGSHCVCHTVDRAIAGDYVERVAALNLENCCQLPSLKKPVSPER